MVVVDGQIAYVQPSTTLVEINLDGIVFHFHHPEHVVRVNMHIEVVILLREVCRPNRASVEVKSNKDECAVMLRPVNTDELALAEAHVRLIRQRCGDSCSRVRSGSATADVRQTY